MSDTPTMSPSQALNILMGITFPHDLNTDQTEIMIKSNGFIYYLEEFFPEEGLVRCFKIHDPAKFWISGEADQPDPSKFWISCETEEVEDNTDWREINFESAKNLSML